ncbi:MAG: rod shape-determining protein RodA [Chloroflexi bacterium]|nr:rod shape-determining protein RodA [Chloroflexota bacterium]
MERLSRPRFTHFDFWLLGATLLLVVIGITMIYSATACITGESLDWESPALRQMLFGVVGVGVLFALAFVDYRLWGALRWLIWGGIIALLGVVILAEVRFGAQRWINLGVTLLQPSEATKLALILVSAKYMGDHAEQMARWRNLGISFLFAAVPMALIFAQPDLGTTMVIAATWGVMAIAAGMRWRNVLIIAGVLAVVAPFVVFPNLRAYQVERVMAFLDPTRDPLGSGYNVTQARIAIGAGGFWGLGFCSGTQSQLRFLRIRQTDFIFSVIGEELGFVGSLFVLALIVFIILRLIRIARLARTPDGKLIAVGVAAVIFIQSWVNLAMNLGLVPAVGVPLPFVSSGGSSLITLMAGLGIAQSILLRHTGLQLEGSGKRYA